MMIPTLVIVRIVRVGLTMKITVGSPCLMVMMIIMWIWMLQRCPENQEVGAEDASEIQGVGSDEHHPAMAPDDKGVDNEAVETGKDIANKKTKSMKIDEVKQQGWDRAETNNIIHPGWQQSHSRTQHMTIKPIFW